MPRRGWQAIEVPSGWYEVIRGPRPPSQKWPRASPHQSAQSRQPLSGSGPPVRQGGRWGQRRGIGRVGQPGQPNRAPSPPKVAISAARQRVVQLETALAALGDTGPEVTMLQTALKRAKQAAQEPPLDVQMSMCEQLVRHQSTTAFDGARRGEDPSSFRVGRRPKSSCKVARGSNHRQGGSCATLRHPARVQRTHCSSRVEDTSGRTQGDTCGKLRRFASPRQFG